MNIDKGTFGSEQEFKVLIILNQEANIDKRVRKILRSFNDNFKDIIDSDLKNKDYIFQLLFEKYSKNVDTKKFEDRISSRLKNYFIAKIRKSKKI